MRHMELKIPLIHSHRELKVKKWRYTDNSNIQKPNEFLILQTDEARDHFLFCVYCVCFATNGNKNKLCNEGVSIYNMNNLRTFINNHMDTLCHQKSESEYFNHNEISNSVQLAPSEFEKIEKNRFIVNEILETLMHLITNSK